MYDAPEIFLATCPIKACEKSAVFKATKNGTQWSFLGQGHKHRGFMVNEELRVLILSSIIIPRLPKNVEAKIAQEVNDNGNEDEGKGRRIRILGVTSNVSGGDRERNRIKIT